MHSAQKYNVFYVLTFTLSLLLSSHKLSPHVDNPYRNPNPGFQLLHALENQCIVTGGSLAVDGYEVARQLKEENSEMFEILAKVPCRWENDGGDKSTALVYFGPQISTNPTTGTFLRMMCI